MLNPSPTDPEVVILKELLARDSGFVSGSALAEKLRMTRVGVWTHMEKLRHQGFCFEAVRSRGYRLAQRPAELSPHLVSALLHFAADRPDILFFDSLDSTNSEAERQLASGRSTPFVIMARRQTRGRGRFGRTWFSDSSSNLYVSFVFRPGIEPAGMQTFTLWMGLNICELLSSFCRVSPGIKWPNDILYGNKKVGGMLTEARIDADLIRELVFGIGLNVNNAGRWPDELAGKAATLQACTGHLLDINRLAAVLVGRVFTAYEAFCSGTYRTRFLELWDQFDLLRGRSLRLVQGEREITGIGKGIDSEGSLRVLLPDGRAASFRAGEVTLEKQPP